MRIRHVLFSIFVAFPVSTAFTKVYSNNVENSSDYSGALVKWDLSESVNRSLVETIGQAMKVDILNSLASDSQLSSEQVEDLRSIKIVVTEDGVNEFYSDTENMRI